MGALAARRGSNGPPRDNWQHVGAIAAAIVSDLARDPEIEAVVDAEAAAETEAPAPRRIARQAAFHEVPA